MSWTATHLTAAPGQRCEHCGETGLKRTVRLTDGDKVINVGTGCALKLTGITSQRLNTQIKRASQERNRVWEAWRLDFYRYKSGLADKSLGVGFSPDSPIATIRESYHRKVAEWLECRPEPEKD